MPRLIHNSRTDKHIRTISILIVSNSFYSGKVKEAIQNAHINKNYDYKIMVVRAECIIEMLEFEVKVPIDYIVFIVDTSMDANIKQVQNDLNSLDKKFFIGRICFVNATNFLQNNILTDLNELAVKYKIPIINGDIKKPNKCELVAERILSLLHANLLMPLPFVPWATHR